jgi:hypothetical protein
MNIVHHKIITLSMPEIQEAVAAHLGIEGKLLTMAYVITPPGEPPAYAFTFLVPEPEPEPETQP